MKNRPFAPGFLKKLDEHWMKKYPLLWSSRIHLVIYYGGLILCPILALAYFAYFNPLSNQYAFTGNILISVIAIVCLVIWIVYLVRFNPYKRFYQEKPASFLKTFLLYFFIITFFISWIFIPQFTGYIGTKLRFSVHQIEKDMYELNESVAGEAYYKAPEYYKLLENKLIISKIDSVEYSYSDPSLVTNTVTYNDRLVEATEKYDSLVKVNDTVFVGITFPDFKFINSSPSFDQSTEPFKSNIERYHQITKHPKSYEEYHSNVLRLTTKYLVLGRSNKHDYWDYDDAGSTNTFGKIESEYREKYALRSIRITANILNDKLEFSYNIRYYLRAIYYLSIYLTTLLFIFRHANARSFFLTLLTGFILFLVSIVLTIVFELHKENQILTLLLAYTITFFVISLFILNDSRKSMIRIIGLNLFTLSFIQVPMIFTFLMDDDWLKKHYHVVEFTSFGLILLLMLIFYRPLYRKWHALPEE